MFEALDFFVSVHVSSGFFLRGTELFKRKFFLPSAEERVVVSESVITGVFVGLRLDIPHTIEWLSGVNDHEVSASTFGHLVVAISASSWIFTACLEDLK